MCKILRGLSIVSKGRNIFMQHDWLSKLQGDQLNMAVFFWVRCKKSVGSSRALPLKKKGFFTVPWPLWHFTDVNKYMKYIKKKKYGEKKNKN